MLPDRPLDLVDVIVRDHGRSGFTKFGVDLGLGGGLVKIPSVAIP
jgi:hypothetical protein